MSLCEILPFARSLIQQVVQPGDLVVDATMGNGHDTLFLANLVGPSGTVLAYDIQFIALQKTKKRLEDAQCLTQVRLFCKGHQTAVDELEQYQQPLSAAMFNLGYLPGGDRSIVTRPETTLLALRGIVRFLKPGGLITVVIYSGHHGGKEEANALLDELSGWNHNQYNIMRYQWLNRPNHPPFLIAIEKR
jgi:predicted methyltransferase